MPPPDATAPAGGPSGARGEVAAALDARLAELRQATAQWGDTHGPEARMISAMIGTIAELSVVARRLEIAHEAAGGRVEAVISAWEANGAKVYNDMVTVTSQSRAVTGDMKEALGRFTKATSADLPEKAAMMMIPRLTQVLTDPIRHRVNLRNREDLLELWLKAGATAIGLAFMAMVFGYVMGVREPSFTDMQVDWCEKNPIVSGDKGYCDLDRLRPAWRSTVSSGN